MATYWPGSYWPGGYWPDSYWPGGTGITPSGAVPVISVGTTAGMGMYVVLLKNLDGEIVAIFSGGGGGME